MSTIQFSNENIVNKDNKNNQLDQLDQYCT